MCNVHSGGKFEEMYHIKIHDEYQFCTFNLYSQIHHLNFHTRKSMSIFFHGKFIFPWFSIFISTRILVSATNSRLWFEVTAVTGARKAGLDSPAYCSQGSYPTTGPLRWWSWQKDMLKAESNWGKEVCLFVGCLTSQQHASVAQGRICLDNFTWCHTEIEVADKTFHLIQSQYTDTGPTSPSTDPRMPGAWQGSHRSANF